jgi:hypothetical protein
VRLEDSSDNNKLKGTVDSAVDVDVDAASTVDNSSKFGLELTLKYEYKAKVGLIKKSHSSPLQ